MSNHSLWRLASSAGLTAVLTILCGFSAVAGELPGNGEGKPGKAEKSRTAEKDAAYIIKQFFLKLKSNERFRKEEEEAYFAGQHGGILGMCMYLANGYITNDSKWLKPEPEFSFLGELIRTRCRKYLIPEGEDEICVDIRLNTNYYCASLNSDREPYLAKSTYLDATVLVYRIDNSDKGGWSQHLVNVVTLQLPEGKEKGGRFILPSSIHVNGKSLVELTGLEFSKKTGVFNLPSDQRQTFIDSCIGSSKP